MPTYLIANGRYLGVDPGDPSRVYADRAKGGAWEEVAITPHPDGWVDVRFLAANRQLCITPDGTLETRPAGAIGAWEQLIASANRTTLLRAGRVFAVEGGGPIAAPGSPLHLEVRGIDFVDAQGARTSLCGCDGFLDYRIWLDHDSPGLDPFLQESTELGFQVRRVFLAGSVKQNGVLDLSPRHEPDFYGQLKPFVQYQNDHGIIPLLTVNVDMQDVMPDAGERRQNWQRINAELRNAGLDYLISGGNEADKNGFDPYADVDDPGSGVIWSRGSRTQDSFYAPNGATAAEFHPVRDFSRCLMDAVASAVYMRAHGCGMLWLDEGIPFDSGSNPSEAWQLARVYATLWSLAILHNRQGQRGQLMTPGTRACAAAWVKGMRLL